jgi:hypothetical protein
MVMVVGAVVDGALVAAVDGRGAPSLVMGPDGVDVPSLPPGMSLLWGPEVPSFISLIMVLVAEGSNPGASPGTATSAAA